MTDKTHPPLEPTDDLRTDYVLIAVGICAAVLALAYLCWS